MKPLAIVSIVLASLLLGSWALAEEPKIVNSRFHTMYIPEGFDNNDHVQVVGEGLFSNTCYRPAAVKAIIDPVEKTIRVAPTAYFYDGFCAMMLVPFHQVIDLGIIPEGRFDVLLREDIKPMGQLNVRAASTSNPDDFLYAPISQAYYQNMGGKHLLTLTGEFTKSCLRLKEVLVNVQPRVITVQPIAEIVDTGTCVDGHFPFETMTEIAQVPAGRYLLHVRSMNAQAVNNLIDVP